MPANLVTCKYISHTLLTRCRMQRWIVLGFLFGAPPPPLLLWWSVAEEEEGPLPVKAWK